MKKLTALILSLMVILCVFTACSDNGTDAVPKNSAGDNLVIKPEGITPIDDVYVQYENNGETPSLLNQFVLLSRESRGGSWQVINTKEEMLFFLESAKDIGGTEVWYIISDLSYSGMYGPTYGVDEVIDGYKDGTWNFDNAEVDYEKQMQEKNIETETTTNETEQAGVSDNSESGGSVGSVIQIIERQVNNWTINEINDCVYESEYDESTGLMAITAIFINANESNPGQKASEVEEFIINKVRLNDIQSSYENFHLGIIIFDGSGNLVLSSLDGERR